MSTAVAPDKTPAPPSLRSAATIVVVRDGDRGMEVLLLRRVERSGDRSSGAFVFPGGTLDAADKALHSCCAGLDDTEASRRLGVPEHGLDYYVAAVRECFEEAGLLFACDASGQVAALSQSGEELAALRASLCDGAVSLQALCGQLELKLAVDRLAYYSHWLTPPGLPKRFDTRFFVAEAPPGQTASFDNLETLEHRWIRPADALDAANRLSLPNPTRHTLQSMAAFSSAHAFIEHTRQLPRIERIMPRMGHGNRGPRPVMPSEPAYGEIERLDPDGRGRVSYELRPGHPVRLSERVLRVTAANGSVMTGPGTNTYIVGDPQGPTWCVIDPGPESAAHVEAILAAAPGPIASILVTHTHRDHSPAAAALQARTGARLLGMKARHPDRQDTQFEPDHTLVHGERLEMGARTTLRVVHTPGHASNHLCYLLEEEATLFTGDHVMQGSTVVIDPPDGDMAEYLASLQGLLDHDLEWLAPGHGFLIARPADEIRRLVRHRLAREAKVDAGLRALGTASLDALLPRVYGDVPPHLHPVARRSLLAHLLKLACDGRAREAGGEWRAVDH
jgi:glyoxylase-like metal-dependent hydrolase (beta-lactamase superfamily II)/8-oxo-dGTP pyrophosphatase MutT (NUDIX family)